MNVKAMTASIVNGTKHLYFKSRNKIMKRSPEILLGIGIVSVVAGTVAACKATIKAETILSETRETIEKIHAVADNPENRDRYSEEDKKKDLTIVYTQTVTRIVINYLPSAIVIGTGIVSILASHNLLQKRNAALAAAYAAIDSSFKDYRKRLTEKYGEDVDQELRYGLKADEAAEESTQDSEDIPKNGIQKKNANLSDYARSFDRLSSYYENDAEFNRKFLEIQQQKFTSKLRTEGVVFLNDVYEALDIPRSKAGQVVGWYFDPTDPKRDNYVSFGLDLPINKRFMAGDESAVWLDFNVDGVVWDYV